MDQVVITKKCSNVGGYSSAGYLMSHSLMMCISGKIAQVKPTRNTTASCYCSAVLLGQFLRQFLPLLFTCCKCALHAMPCGRGEERWCGLIGHYDVVIV
jgi:hypothetical protein